MKKVMVSVMIVLFIFLVSCVDYKAYDLPQETEDNSLLDEIALIEEELAQEEGLDAVEESLNDLEDTEEIEDLEEETIEEVILPELTEEDTVDSPADTTVITVKENELVSLKVNITDPDEDPVTFSFTAPINKTGQWKTNYGDAGEYMVTLTATDGRLTSSQKIQIVVERVNVAPLITKVKDINVDEGEIIELEPVVSDPNNDPVTVTITEPLANGRFDTDHTSAGQYSMTITASDGELESQEAFTLTINDVNVLPVADNVQDITVKEGETVEIKPTVTDLDEDNVILSITEPIGDDGLWETSFTDHGEYLITITADDGKDKVKKKITVIVEDVNMPPRIVDISADIN